MASVGTDDQAAAKEERLDLRLPRQTKQLLQQAAELVGTSLGAFVLAHVVLHAQKIVLDSRLIELSEGDARTFVEALEADAAEPNAALRDACQRYTSQVG